MKLFDCVEMVENNWECVVLKVKEGSEMNLICLGSFNGNETIFRLTKGEDHTCTVWYKDGHSFSWCWGISGYTLVSDEIRNRGLEIERCIEEDFDIYMGANKNLRERTLYKEMPEHREHVFEFMYWPGKENEVCIHKDKEYYKHKHSIKSLLEELNNKGYTVVKNKKYKASTGCIVEEYKAVI